MAFPAPAAPGSRRVSAFCRGGALSRSNIEVYSRKIRTPSGWRCIRPAKESRRIDHILSQWTDSEIARMHGAEARGSARLREIREALGRTASI